MEIIPSDLTDQEVYFVLTGCVTPRPIAFVSSLSVGGALNLAPFSFFNVACSAPPILGFAPGPRADGRLKDTAANIQETGEFVINVVSMNMADGMNETAFDYDPGVSEFEAGGFTPLASDLIKPPRVAEAPISMECRLDRMLQLGKKQQYLILGEVLKFHISDDIVDDKGRISVAKLQPVGRLNGILYCRSEDQFAIARPTEPVRQKR